MLPEPSEIPIGILHSLSGPMAVSEHPLVEAALMAVDEINQSGGILGHRLRAVVMDGASDTAQFARLARRLIADEHVESLFGCWTSASRKAVKPIVEERASLLWYPMQYEGLEESAGIVYTGSCLNQQIEPAVRWFLAQGKRRCLLVGSDYVFPRTVNRLISVLLRSEGGTVLGDYYVHLGCQDFREPTARCVALRPEIIFNTLNGESNFAFFRSLRAAGVRADEIPVVSFSVAEGEQSLIGVDGAGHYSCWSYFQTLETPENREFLRRYHRRFGLARPCSDPVVMAYSQVYLWKQAVEAADSFKAAEVRRCLAGRSYLSPAGWLKIQPNLHLDKWALIGKAREDGQFDVVWRCDRPIRPNPWLGLEELELPAYALIKEVLSEFPQSVHYAAQLELEIAQRKAVEEKFRMASHYTRSLIEASLDPLVTIGPQGTIMDVNQATEAVTGFPRKALIGTEFSAYFSDPGKAQAGYQQVFREGMVRDYELEMRHLDGHLTPVLYNAVVYRDEQGGIAGIFAAARDMTERQRAEAARNRLAAIVEFSDDAIIGEDLNGRITSWNPGAEKLYGYAAEEVLGQKVSILIPPGHPDEEPGILEKIARGERVKHYETQRMRKDGRRIDVSLTFSPVQDNQGNIIGASKITRDITERKRNEEQIRKASLYARSLIEASLDPLVTISREGKITDVNQATELVTGISRDQLIGSDFSDYFTEPDQARGGYQEAFSHGTVRDYPLAIRHVSGKLTDVLYNASIYRDDRGTVQGVFAAARDITLRKRLEEELRHLNADLERRVKEEVAENRAKDHLLIQQSRLAAMGEMVHNIAHQWRQPLNALSIILANIKDAYDYQELNAEFMASKVAQCHGLLQRMSTTIDDFRDFFRPDREPGEFDISQAVEDALFVMEASLKNSQIEVVKDLSRGLMVYGFCNQFSQVVLNIIANAKDALQEQRVANRRIELGLYRDGNQGILSIRDNAGGIPETVLPKIFDPYFTTKEKGSGIGLYMSKMILERNLSGTIAVSNFCGGASVTLALPLLPMGREA